MESNLDHLPEVLPMPAPVKNPEILPAPKIIPEEWNVPGPQIDPTPKGENSF